MKILISLFLLLAACSSLPVEPESCPACVEKTYQDPFGLLTIKAPDTTAFDTMAKQPLRLHVECQYSAKNLKAEEQLDLSKDGQQLCQKIAGKILMAKGFILLPAVDASSESWIFHFEETRKEFDGVRVSTVFVPAESARTWGTLTRFKGKSATPYSHLALSGSSRFERETIRVKPADEINVHVDEKSLLGDLIKALTHSAIQNR